MTKYLVKIEFRYNAKVPNEQDSSYKRKEIAIAICETFDEATQKGNEALEIFEKHFESNKAYNRKERFSKNGGPFGTKEDLISNLGYLKNPFPFLLKLKRWNLQT